MFVELTRKLLPCFSLRRERDKIKEFLSEISFSRLKPFFCWVLLKRPSIQICLISLSESRRNSSESEEKRCKSLILNNPFVTQKLVVLKEMEIVHMQWQKVQSSKVVDIHGWKKGNSKKTERNKVGEWIYIHMKIQFFATIFFLFVAYMRV